MSMLAAVVFALGLGAVPQASVVSTEVVVAIRIQGNLLASDDEIKSLAGLTVGMALEPDTVTAVTTRLRETGRFKRVEVLKRFASIDDPTQIVIVVIVDEGGVAIDWGNEGETPVPAKVVPRRGLGLMFLPILNFEDGYGFTYGARLGRPGPFGQGSHLSVPLTWGGDKRAALEVQKNFARGPVSGIDTGASVNRQTHPFYAADEDRQHVWLTGRRAFGSSLSISATTGWEHVVLLDRRDDFLETGANVVLDTRLDPALPRNAVYARAAWTRSGIPDTHEGPVNEILLDARAYAGLPGQSILMVRALREDSDGPLPSYLKSMLGGMPNLRGFRRGVAVGDTLTAGSLEVRTPLNSPLKIARMGVTGFVDVGTTYDAGGRLSDQKFERSVGGGIWLSAAVLRLNLVVAHGLGGTTRVHFSTTLSP